MAHAQRARNRPALLRAAEALECGFPAEVGAAPGEPTGRIKRNPPTRFCGDQPDEIALGAHRPAADACPARSARINPFCGHGKDVEALRRYAVEPPLGPAEETLSTFASNRAA